MKVIAAFSVCLVTLYAFSESHPVEVTDSIAVRRGRREKKKKASDSALEKIKYKSMWVHCI